jgi:hypothetical protein
LTRPVAVLAGCLSADVQQGSQRTPRWRRESRGGEPVANQTSLAREAVF